MTLNATGAPQNGLAYVNRTDGFKLADETVADALIRLGHDAADAPAVMWATGRGAAHLTWSELGDRAQRGAATLLELNPRRDRVAIAALNSVDWLVALFACAVAGMPVVPVSASGADDETGYQLDHARVGLVLAAKCAGEHRVLERMGVVASSLQTPPAVCDIAEICAADPATPVSISADDEFLVQYTSGTTGRPKAACLSHRAALGSAAVFMTAVGGASGDRFLNPLPLNHVGGSLGGIIAALSIGATYVLVERFSSHAVLDAIRETRPSLAGLVPTMMIDLLALPGVTSTDFACLRTIVGGATAVDPALIAELENRSTTSVIGSYGQSEAPAITASSPDDTPRARTQTIGRCLRGRDIAIRLPGGSIAGMDEVGELHVRGPLTMSGYLRSDGSLDPAFDSEGWRATGDLCSMDAAGLVTFHGRSREVVIRGGLNVYPAEVEQAIAAHETVSEVAVFGVSDTRLGERVIAAVIASPRADVDVAELSALAKTRLSSYKRPAEWVVVTSLPRTNTGKVRKHVLRAWYENGSLSSVDG